MKRIKNINFKNIFKNIKLNIKKYASTNILFLSYVIISLLISFSMRMITVGAPIYLKSFLGDLVIVLILGSFGYFLRPSSQFKYFFTWLIFFTFLTVGNTIYYTFYQSYLSINLLATASMIGQVNGAVFEKIHLYQFVDLIGLVIFIFIHKKLNKRKYYFEVEKTENGKRMFVTLIIVSLVILLFFLSNSI